MQPGEEATFARPGDLSAHGYLLCNCPRCRDLDGNHPHRRKTDPPRPPRPSGWASSFSSFGVWSGAVAALVLVGSLLTPARAQTLTDAPPAASSPTQTPGPTSSLPADPRYDALLERLVLLDVPVRDVFVALGRAVGAEVIVHDAPAGTIRATFQPVPMRVLWDTYARLYNLATYSPAPGVLVVGPAPAIDRLRPSPPTPAAATPPAAQASGGAEVTRAPTSYAARVRVLELGETGSLQLGVNWDNGLLTTLLDGTRLLLSGGTPAPLASDPITALEREGLARKLDDVRLPLVSGVRGQFRSGGSLQINLVGGEQNITRSVAYGLTLSLLATEGPEDVRLDVSVDLSNPVNASDPTLLNLTTRGIDTSVRLRPGSTVLLGGLLTLRDESSGSGLPGLSRVPLAGYLAGSISNASQRSSLVVSVTLEAPQ